MNKKWKPNNGEKYFFVDATGEAFATMWNGGFYDQCTYQQGNCFPTKREAEIASVKVRDLLLSLHGEQPATDCSQLPDCRNGGGVDSNIGATTTVRMCVCTDCVNNRSRWGEYACNCREVEIQEGKCRQYIKQQDQLKEEEK